MAERKVTLAAPTGGKNGSVWNLGAIANQAAAAINELITKINGLLALSGRNGVLGTAAGLTVDGGNAENTEMTNAVDLSINGRFVRRSAVAEFDISTLGAAGATIAVSTSGVAFHFLGPTSATDEVEVGANASTAASVIAAWAAWYGSAQIVTAAANKACIGAALVTEGGSGTFTWGTDSITTETETYHDFIAHPGVVVPVATLATHSTPAQIAYGAGTIVLGTGTAVALTGKVGVAMTGSNVADGAVGAWLLVALADDTEAVVQLGAAYASLAAAQTAVRTHLPNPMLAVIGEVYVVNASGAAFVPATTSLAATGIAATYVITQPGTEYGRDAAGQPFASVADTVDTLTFRNVGAPS